MQETRSGFSADFSAGRGRRQRVLGAVLAGILAGALFLIGCERPISPVDKGHAPRRDARVLFIAPPAADSRSAAMVSAARRAIREFGSASFDVVHLTPIAEGALGDLSRALERRPTVVCLYIDEAQPPDTAIDAVARSGAMVISVGGSDGRLATYGHVAVANAAAAEELGRQLRALAGDRKGYVLVHADGAGDAATQCYRRFFAAARQSPTPALLKELNLATPAGRRGVEATREVVDLFPSSRLLVAIDARPLLDAPPATVIGPQRQFIVLSTAPALWSCLHDGSALALVGPLDGEIGAAAAKIAIRALTGSERPPVVVDVHCELVTPDTLADFEQRYTAAAGDPS